MKQSGLMSLVEAIANVVVGYGIAVWIGSGSQADRHGVKIATH